ncbi:MAG: hypothetical protein B6U97_04055 [Candidatus Altiarchaeales archaeon ex4484_96]|nr:MAG: hypothetical protein B6U97_04055 [Candidatus Altiarchaeales archaeon ex4484_96]
MTDKKQLVLLETDVDDCTPEVLSYLMDRLFEEGALDVQFFSAVMKKGRPGYLVRVLSSVMLEEKLSGVLMEETGTLGVRVLPVLRRYTTRRQIIELEVEVSGVKEKIRVKKSPHNIKPEYDDVAQIARKHGLSYRRVLDLVDEVMVDF